MGRRERAESGTGRGRNVAGARDANGEPTTNANFPDMKGLVDHIHAMGLKAGLYSSPGPTTCQGLGATWQHEEQDARAYARWGFDYLKYDWCGYSQIAPMPTLDDRKKPYKLMGDILEKQDRDIVFSLCQYGAGNVWEWGKDVGGHLWRMTGDIRDDWPSMTGIGFQQTGHEQFAGPGGWNDTDMLVVGIVGWSQGTRPTNLTPNEQLTHISLWALQAAPLLIGADLSQIDDWTTNILGNREMLGVNQDALGKAAGRKTSDGWVEVWARPLADGRWQSACSTADPRRLRLRRTSRTSVSPARSLFAISGCRKICRRRQDNSRRPCRVTVSCSCESARPRNERSATRVFESGTGGGTHRRGRALRRRIRRETRGGVTHGVDAGPQFGDEQRSGGAAGGGPRDVRLRRRAAATEPLAETGGRGPRLLLQRQRRRHPQRVPRDRRTRRARVSAWRVVRRRQQQHLRSVAERDVASRARYGRHRAREQGAHALHRMGEDGEARRRRARAALRVRQARWRTRRSAKYGKVAEAGPILERITAFADKTFDRAKMPLADPTHNQHYYGLPQERYTLQRESLSRVSADRERALSKIRRRLALHRVLGEARKTASPADAHGVHAYSHTNAFSSAAMTYDVTRDVKSLTIVRNGYDYLQGHQCYATGGYGPNERYMAIDGALGHALDTRSDTFETSCGSWAGFKMARYLIQFTGEARYGDWIERLLYNAIGAALPVTERGRNSYYSDYRVGGGMKSTAGTPTPVARGRTSRTSPIITI